MVSGAIARSAFPRSSAEYGMFLYWLTPIAWYTMVIGLRKVNGVWTWQDGLTESRRPIKWGYGFPGSSHDCACMTPIEVANPQGGSSSNFYKAISTNCNSLLMSYACEISGKTTLSLAQNQFDNIVALVDKCPTSKCPVGTYFDRNSMLTCTLCQTGKYSNVTGASSCISCASSGKTSLNSCTSCQMGEYSSSIGLSTCINCPEGYWMNSTGNSVCYECPEGSTCPSGSSFPTCPSGFFRGSKDLTVFLKCIPSQACVQSADSGANCATGFAGNLCEECAFGCRREETVTKTV